MMVINVNNVEQTVYIVNLKMDKQCANIVLTMIIISYLDRIV